MSELKIANWNIFWGLGYPKSPSSYLLKGISYFRTREDRKNIPKIAKVLNDLSPDVITLQEIDLGSRRNGKFNQITEISKLTGLKNNYFAVEKDWLGYFKDGNAILSKYNFQEVNSKDLPYKMEKRNYILSKLKIKNKQIIIIATHLSAHKYNQKERMEQVKELCKIINKIKGPLVLIGDLNCKPTSKEFLYLKNNSNLEPIINNPTYPSFNPQKIFDQIMITSKINVKSVKVINTKNSDHFPIFAHLQF